MKSDAVGWSKITFTIIHTLFNQMCFNWMDAFSLSDSSELNNKDGFF